MSDNSSNICNRHYSRWSIQCQACEGKCAPALMRCYGAYDSANMFCRQCKFAEYCRDAKEPPSRALDALRVEQSLPAQSEDTARSMILRQLWESCNRDPMQVAIVVARAEGMTQDQIASSLGVSQPAVLKRIKKSKVLPE